MSCAECYRHRAGDPGCEPNPYPYGHLAIPNCDTLEHAYPNPDVASYIHDDRILYGDGNTYLYNCADANIDCHCNNRTTIVHSATDARLKRRTALSHRGKAGAS